MSSRTSKGRVYDMCQSDIWHAQWLDTDGCRRSFTEGWGLFVNTTRTNGLTIEYARDTPHGSQFRTDLKAQRHVMDMARKGSAHHKRAIDLIREHNFAHYMEMVAACAEDEA